MTGWGPQAASAGRACRQERPPPARSRTLHVEKSCIRQDLERLASMLEEKRERRLEVNRQRKPVTVTCKAAAQRSEQHQGKAIVGVENVEKVLERMRTTRARRSRSSVSTAPKPEFHCFGKPQDDFEGRSAGSPQCRRPAPCRGSPGTTTTRTSGRVLMTLAPQPTK
jgi:hypothetical protein